MYRQIDEIFDNIFFIKSNEIIINENMEIETTRTLQLFYIIKNFINIQYIIFDDNMLFFNKYLWIR